MKCFHHNDLDGYCSARIVAVYENDFNSDDFIEVDYKTLLPIDRVSKNEKVYIVDYSISENTYQSLVELLKITNDIIWIDHHVSSIKMLENHRELSVILDNPNSIVNTLYSYSGAALTYMSLYKKADYNSIPTYIRFVSDYDTWKYEYGKDTEYFKCGMEMYPYKPFDEIWEKLEKDIDREDFLSGLIESGRSIRVYLEQNYKFKRSYLSYEVELDGYKCLVVNLDGNSWVFGDEIENQVYDVFILWHYDGEYYSYSLYSSNKRDVDVSKIAENHGGGGHKHASGFKLKELIL